MNDMPASRRRRMARTADENTMDPAARAQVMQELSGATSGVIAKIEKDDLDFTTMWSDLEAKAEEAVKVVDPNARNIKLQILSSDVGVYKAGMKTREQDLAKAVFGLNAMIEHLGVELEDLRQKRITKEDQALIDEVMGRLAAAQQKLTEAEHKMFEFRREAARLEAQAEINQIMAELKETENLVAQKARDRLMSHTLGDSLNEITVMADTCVKLMQKRVESLTGQIDVAKRKLEHSFQIKEKAGARMKELEQELGKKEAELAEEQKIFSGIDSGDDAYALQEKKVTDLATMVEELRGKHIEALAVYQSKEKFVLALDEGIVAMTKLKDNHKMWIKSLISDTEDRRVTFQNHLEMAKALSDQEYAEGLDEVGASADQQLAEAAAEAVVASDKVRIKRLRAQPQRMQAIAEVTEALAQHIREDRDAMDEILAEFKDKYGIDPMERSFVRDMGNAA